MHWDYAATANVLIVFSISTGALGTVSIVEYFLRFHRLWRKGSTCRVIGAQRFYVRHSLGSTEYANVSTAGLVSLESLGCVVFCHD